MDRRSMASDQSGSDMMRKFASAMPDSVGIRILICKDLPWADPVEPSELSDREVLLKLFEPGIDPDHIRLLVSESPGYFIH